MAEEDASFALRASRQKSCNTCVKAKRACDKRYPVCSRCEQKRVLCIYGKRTFDDAFDESFGFGTGELDLAWDGFMALPEAIDGNVDATVTLPLGHTEFLMPEVMSGNMQLVGFEGEQSNGSPEKEETLSKFDYAPMADICQDYEPWQVYNPNSKAHYIVSTIKFYPSSFATDNHTPWMHRHLYKDHMPASIQSCFTVCTLYSNMTSSNKTSVFRVLWQNIGELRECVVTTDGERLARVQALLLYQIVCLFDGDVTLRSLADRDMLLLQEWTDNLCGIRENLNPSQEMGDSIMPISWEAWMFSESVRRTIIAAYIFLGLWTVMSRNDANVLGAWKHLHYWTVSRPLWEAPSSFEFFVAWKENPHFIVANFEVGGLLKNARGKDVDDFMKLMVVISVGLDVTKQWFMDRDSVF